MREGSTGGSVGNGARGKRAWAAARAGAEGSIAGGEAAATHRIQEEEDRNWSSPPNGVLVISSRLVSREDVVSEGGKDFFFSYSLYNNFIATSSNC